MKRTLGLSLFYAIYLIVLGQGCSAFKESKLVKYKLIDTSKSESTVFSKYEVKKRFKVTNTDGFFKGLEDSANKPLVIAAKKSIPVTRKAIIEVKASKKNFDIKDFEIVQNLESANQDETKEDSNQLESKNTLLLSNKTKIEHFGFEVNSQVKTLALSDLLNEASRKVAFHQANEKKIDNTKLAETKNDIKEDSVATVQASTVEKYDPADPALIANFESVTDLDLVEVARNAREKNKIVEKSDELVMIDYSNDDQAMATIEDNINSLATVASIDPSNRVSQVINRELQSPAKKRVQKSVTSDLIKELREENQTDYSEETDYSEGIQLYAIEADLNDGLRDDITNFEFAPSYDTNDYKKDYGDGRILLKSKVSSHSGILRGAIIKNYFMRTTIELPVGTEYTKFEIPVITQESMEAYLESHNLDGYGGHFLVDLGETIEDVEIEDLRGQKQNMYEHRLHLNESFKAVTPGKGYRYILFIGVIPGNVNVRYLGVNGQESSKISFIAPEEITYEFSQFIKPEELTIETRMQHTLGKTTGVLNVAPEKIVSVNSGEQSTLIAPGEHKVVAPWRMLGSRTYYEIQYLSDSLFFGVDQDKAVEFPSIEFIGEILRNFRMEGLNQECIVQLNFKKQIKDIKVLSESYRGPSYHDFAYLDEDGVFSAQISPLTSKAMFIGNEEGIFSIKVEYEDSSEDYLRTYCSKGSYLLEQL